MRMLDQLFLAAVLVTTSILAAAPRELADEPRDIDTLGSTSAQVRQDSSAQKIIIYAAKTIVTLDPGTPTAEAVAVMNGKILGVGTLDEVRGWITKQEFEIDRRFQDAVIVPGFIEAHMHPQFAGVLWEGVYVGHFDRIAPDGAPIKGLETKAAVIERLRNAAAQLPADGSWLLAWGYQPEFYGNAPLTRADLDPVSNGHPIFIENLSMHIYYANSRAFEIAGITGKTDLAGIVRKDGEPTGEIKELMRRWPSQPRCRCSIPGRRRRPRGMPPSWRSASG
jgi:predicted amidohydrolase YtcJ